MPIMPTFKAHKAGGHYAIESLAGGGASVIINSGQGSYNDVFIFPTRLHVASFENDGNVIVQGGGGIIASVIPPYVNRDVDIERYDLITVTNNGAATISLMLATSDVVEIVNAIYKHCACT